MILNDHLALHMECKFRSENYSYSCSIPLESDRLLAEIGRLGLPRFETLIHKRAAYREAFLTGKPPHFAERSRTPVKKTIEEIDSLLVDVKAILCPTPMKAAANAR